MLRHRHSLAAAVLLFGVTPCAAAGERITLSAHRPTEDLHRTEFAAPEGTRHRVVQRLYSYVITESSHPDFAGARTLNVAHMDEFDGTGTHAGYAVWRLKDGTEAYLRFDGSHVAEGDDASRATRFKGTLSLVGGTGRHTAGAGEYHGRADAKGSRMKVELELEAGAEPEKRPDP